MVVKDLIDNINLLEKQISTDHFRKQHPSIYHYRQSLVSPQWVSDVKVSRIVIN